jgi:hypothetical protein
MRLVDYTSTVHGDYTVLNRTSEYGKKPTTWKGKCNHCGREVQLYATHIQRGAQKRCVCQPKPKGATHPQWNGCGEISGNFFDGIRRGAGVEFIVYSTRYRTKRVRKGRPGREHLSFTITVQDIWELFLKQNRRCALSGVTIHFGEGDVKPTASLDRIDNSKGYTFDNVQWLHKDVNRMKNVFDQDYFISICRKITQRHV